MQRPNKQHWRIWDDYPEVSAEALRLANVTRYDVVFRPWDGGWVIFNLLGLYTIEGYRQEEQAQDTAADDEGRLDALMRDTSKDNYSDEDYEREQQRLEADDYRALISSFN